MRECVHSNARRQSIFCLLVPRLPSPLKTPTKVVSSIVFRWEIIVIPSYLDVHCSKFFLSFRLRPFHSPLPILCPFPFLHPFFYILIWSFRLTQRCFIRKWKRVLFSLFWISPAHKNLLFFASMYVMGSDFIATMPVSIYGLRSLPGANRICRCPTAR